MDQDTTIAARLNDAMEEAGRVASGKIAAIILKRAQADVPVGDPAVDPDPSFRLRDKFEIREFGSYFSIVVTAPYAIKVHESRHLRHPRGGGMKFLERAVISAIPMWQQILAIEVEKKLREDFREPVPDMLGAIGEMLARGSLAPGVKAGKQGTLLRIGKKVK